MSTVITACVITVKVAMSLTLGNSYNVGVIVDAVNYGMDKIVEHVHILSSDEESAMSISRNVF